MKSFMLLMFALLIAVCPYAAVQEFDLLLDENGAHTDSQDFGWNILLVGGNVDSECYLTLQSVKTREVYFEGQVGPDSTPNGFVINKRAKEMTIIVTGGKANTTIKCSVEWKLGKAAELFSTVMPSGKKGACTYKSVVQAEQGASISVNDVMVSHDCKITITLDGQSAFCQEVKAGQIYKVMANAQKVMKVCMKNAPRYKNVHLSMDVSMAGNAMFAKVQQEDEQLMSLLNMDNGQDLYKVEFDQTSNEHGCIETDAYNLTPKGASPQIKMLVVDRKFSNMTMIVNEIKLPLQLALSFNGRHYYKVGFGLKNGEKLELGLAAEGCQPLNKCHFLLVCEDFQETK